MTPTGRTGAGTGRRRRAPSTAGPQVTDRDIEIIGWVCRHGVVTPAQIFSAFFSSQSAATRRIRILEGLKLLRQDRTFWKESNVVRATRRGSTLADVGIGPATLVLSEVRHALAVVDLAERLFAKAPAGTVLRTERELWVDRRQALAKGRPRGLGRMPDALFIDPSGRTVALELDLTPKRANDYERIVIAYLQERVDKVLWYVPPRIVGKVENAIKAQQAGDVFTVRPWEG